jgi:glycerol-3-phosphate acyltransferase PlsX
MKIAVDAMGGDLGLQITVPGAVQASREHNLDVVLVGIEDRIRAEIIRLGGDQTRLTIVNATESVGMGDGVFAVRRLKRSSIRIGVQLVKDGRADAFVSMGNTAAVVYISRLIPTLKGLSLLLDVGANANCQPEDLAQFAVMGKVYMEQVLGCRNPSIGLMSIGEEEGKGNELTKQAFERLSSLPLNFIGNVEGKDLFAGKADVIVSDGFTGNVALKVSEGVVETLFHMAKREMMKNFFAKIGLLLMKGHLKRIYKKVDYSEYGGAQLLGLNGVCIIGHGRSNSNAVKNAVRLARDFVAKRVQEKIQEELGRSVAPREAKA